MTTIRPASGQVNYDWKVQSVASDCSRIFGAKVNRVLAVLSLVILAGCIAPDRIAYGSKAAANAEIEGFDNIRMYADARRPLPLPNTRRNINYLVLSGGARKALSALGR